MPYRAIIPKRDPFAAIPVGVQKAVRELGLAAFAAQRFLQDYPPAVTSYRRTGTLGRSWHTTGPRTRGRDLVFTVAQNLGEASYGPLVQGPPGTQMLMHQSRGWHNVEQAKAVIQARLPRIRELMKGHA